MKSSRAYRYSLASLGILAAISLSSISAHALSLGSSARAGATSVSAADQAKITAILQRGDKEIARRLATLNTLDIKINNAPKLSSSDKSALATEVSDEITNLTNLQAKLDADTDIATARADAQSIINDYRVYALIAPKVTVVRAADDELDSAAKLTTLATKLQGRLTDAQKAGKDTTSLQAKLTHLNSQISSAQSIASSVQTKVLALQPSDYNSDHAVFSGTRDQLKTTQADLKTATSDAQAIATGLKNLE